MPTRAQEVIGPHQMYEKNMLLLMQLEQDVALWKLWPEQSVLKSVSNPENASPRSLLAAMNVGNNITVFNVVHMVHAHESTAQSDETIDAISFRSKTIISSGFLNCLGITDSEAAPCEKGVDEFVIMKALLTPFGLSGNLSRRRAQRNMAIHSIRTLSFEPRGHNASVT